MRIDNSRAKLWWECGLAYWERYVQNIEPVGKWESVGFGTRTHQLIECRHKQMQGVEVPEYPEARPEIEAEAQLTFAAYEAHYPEEEFEVVGVEEYFEVPIPGMPDCICGGEVVIGTKSPFVCMKCTRGFDPSGYHLYIGEFDAIVRMKDSGKLWLFETKTEKRGSKTNLPDSWQQKSQVGLYLWAAEQKYAEQFEGILLNIITRQSPKGQERPCFRRDSLVRTRGQQQEAVRNLVWIADQIEGCDRTGFWPSNRNRCVGEWGWKCDYYPLHSTEERSEELVQIKYQTAEEYLSGL